MTASTDTNRSDLPETEITLEKARKMCDEAIAQGFETENPVLIDALPSMGKSTGVLRWAARTNSKLTLFTERHKLLDQLSEEADDLGLSWVRALSFHKDCPTANGSHGDGWRKEVAGLYSDRGLSGEQIHRHAQRLLSKRLPCHGDCEYFDRDIDDPTQYDLILGTFKHAYVEKNVEDRDVAIDEFPEDAFITEYDGEMVGDACTHFLGQNDAIPIDDWTGLIEARGDSRQLEKAMGFFEKNPKAIFADSSGVLNDKGKRAHVFGGAFVYVVLAAENLGNGLEFATLPDGRRAIRERGGGKIKILHKPDLDTAKSVIALDGTPVLEKWQLVLGRNFEHLPVLSDNEKKSYIENILKMDIVQMSSSAKSYSGGSAVTAERDLIIFEAISRRHDENLPVITTKKALNRYEQERLEKVGVINTEYYGNLKGINTYSNTRLGIVSGSTHYSDDYIKMWGGFAGISVERTPDSRGMDLDYGSFGNHILRGMREKEVLQAILRFGRDGGGATVYVLTAAIPNWVPKEVMIPRVRKFENGKKGGLRQVIDAIGDRAEWRTNDLRDQVSISVEQLREHLNTLADFGYIQRHGQGRGRWWSNDCIESITENQLGLVTFSEDIGT
jgi:hypothetical protein